MIKLKNVSHLVLYEKMHNWSKLRQWVVRILLFT